MQRKSVFVANERSVTPSVVVSKKGGKRVGAAPVKKVAARKRAPAKKVAAAKAK